MRLGVAAAIVDGEIIAGDVEIIDGRIDRFAVDPPGGEGLAVAGFIDLQVNGFGEVDFLGAAPKDYEKAGQALLRTGVTGYQPTFITTEESRLTESLRTYATALEDPERKGGASPRLLGAHLEGPFISPDRLGTHPSGPRRDPDPALAERLLDTGVVRYMTIAPELPGALDLVDLLSDRGVIVAAGHSNADAASAHAAFDRGVRTVTHLFNAMPRMTPRAPGLPGAALARDDVIVQMIVDGHHLADETVLLAWRAAAGRCALVTDATAAAGMGDGRYVLGDVDVVVSEGAVRREDGTLAGSALTMIDAVRNLHGLGIELTDALAAATSVPARVLGRDDIGRLTIGGPADVVVLDDRLEIRDVLIGGEAA